MAFKNASGSCMSMSVMSWLNLFRICPESVETKNQCGAVIRAVKSLECNLREDCGMLWCSSKETTVKNETMPTKLNMPYTVMYIVVQVHGPSVSSSDQHLSQTVGNVEQKANIPSEIANPTAFSHPIASR